MLCQPRDGCVQHPDVATPRAPPGHRVLRRARATVGPALLQATAVHDAHGWRAVAAQVAPARPSAPALRRCWGWRRRGREEDIACTSTDGQTNTHRWTDRHIHSRSHAHTHRGTHTQRHTLTLTCTLFSACLISKACMPGFRCCLSMMTVPVLRLCATTTQRVSWRTGPRGTGGRFPVASARTSKGKSEADHVSRSWARAHSMMRSCSCGEQHNKLNPKG